jgi:hypothetical protein
MNGRAFTEYLREFRAHGKISVESAVIVLHGDVDDGDGSANAASGEATLMISEPSAQWRKSMLEPEPSALGLVFPIAKRPGTAFDYISVGRTSNADIMLPLAQVSKFHAYFSKVGANEWTVADGGSKNGTRVGSRRLEVRSPVPVRSGERVTFGPYTFSFYTPQGFIELVLARVKVPGSGDR